MLVENEVLLQVGDITLEPGVNMYGITGDDAMDCGTLGANCASGDKYLGHSRNVSHPASHPASPASCPVISPPAKIQEEIRDEIRDSIIGKECFDFFIQLSRKCLVMTHD